MKFSATALVLAASAYGASSLIPSGVSAGCSSFLNELNADSTLSNCVNPLIAATQSFSPTSGKTPSSADVNVALAKLCGSGSGCDEGNVRNWLGKFASACSAELGSNKQVLELYDVLYVFTPLKAAVCETDQSQYCVNKIRKASSVSTNAAAGKNGTSLQSTSDLLSIVEFASDNLISSANFLSRRFLQMIGRQSTQANLATVVTPNATTYQDTNLPFLFIQPSMAKDALCTPCTRAVFVDYVKWENSLPYGPGLANSPILGGQSKLFAAIKSTCGDAFTSAITQEAGGNGATASAALPRAAAPALVAVFAGAVALVMV